MGSGEGTKMGARGYGGVDWLSMATAKKMKMKKSHLLDTPC